MRNAFKLIPLCALLACGESDPEVPSSIVVTPGSVTFTQIGETQQFTAVATDVSGKELSGINLAWSSTDEGVASVTQTGLATAVNTGTTTIRAAIETVGGVASVTVDPSVSEVAKLAGDNQTWEINESVPVNPTVEVRDGGGAGVAGLMVNWTVTAGGGSVSAGTSITNQDGQASIVWTLGSPSGSTQTLQASVNGITADFAATAAEGLLRITTTSLDNARQATTYVDGLAAAGGSGSGYSFSVVDGGLPTGISLASDGTIAGTTSGDGAFPFTAQVTDGAGGMSTRAYVFLVCDPAISLAAGETFIAGVNDISACGIFLPAGVAGDTYRVTLLRAVESESSGTATVTLTMDASGPVTAPPATTSIVAARDPFRGVPVRLRNDLRVAEATEGFHHELRQAEARLVQRLGAQNALKSVELDADGRFVAAASRMPDPPNTATFLFPAVPSGPTACSSGQSTPSTLIAFNDRLALYQANALEGTSDTIGLVEANRMLDYYQSFGHPVIEDYFGGTSDINGDERVQVLAVPQTQISQVGGNVAAFVWSGDFFPQTSTVGGACAASDEMELVYFNADIINDMRAGSDTYQALATMVHEVKHVSSLYNRLQSSNSQNPFHPTFLEEGTAEIAGEVSSRLAWADAGGPAVGAEVLQQAFQDDGFTPENWGVVLRQARTVFYLSSQPNGVAAAPSAAQSGINGSGWLFHRFLGDAYGNASTARADSALFRQQNDSSTTTGFNSYVSVTGRSYVELLEEFATAVTLDGTGAPEPTRTFTTYRLPESNEIFSLPDPAGVFPWTITRTCSGTPCSTGQLTDIESEEGGMDNDDEVEDGISYRDISFTGTMGVGGIRVHEFVSTATGNGAEVRVDAPSEVRVIVARIN